MAKRSGRSFDDYDKVDDPVTAARMLGFDFLKIFLFVLLPLGAVLGGAGYVFGIFGETATVAQQEFGPQAALAKYEWFKDAAAQLEAKRANIDIYEARITAQDKAFKGVPRSKWPRDEREQRAVWESEVAGVIASYNNLAADYNAQMSKFNWRFANRGELPPGAENPLPRDFKPYISGGAQ